MRQDNQVIVSTYTEKMKSNESVFITGFSGLTVPEVNELRVRLNTVGAEYRVVKNRLFKIIYKESGYSDPETLDFLFKSSSAFTFGGSDVVTIAKSIVDFSKKHEKLEVKGAFVDGRVLDKNEVKSLAALPSKQVLLGQVVSTIAAPLTGLMGVLSANLRNIAGVIRAIKERRRKDVY